MMKYSKHLTYRDNDILTNCKSNAKYVRTSYTANRHIDKKFSVQKLLAVAFLLLLSKSITAQKVWNLQDCINYALQHNIDLSIQKNELSIQEIKLHQSKANLFPDINMGVNIYNNYGRNIDGNTNAITFNQTLSNAYWIGASITVFQGFIKRNTIQMNKYLLQADMMKKEVLKNKLVMDVITTYYSLQYSIGLEEVAKSQVELAENQYHRMQKLLEADRETPLNVQDLKRQWMSDKLQLAEAKHTKDQEVLKLKKLLNVKTNDAFKVAYSKPLIDSGKVLDNDIFLKDIETFPQIRQQDLLQKVAQKEYAIAKGRIMPSLRLSAGYNTYYFDGNPLGFTKQLHNNQNQQIFLSLYIPIFNGAKVRSDIRQKKLNYQNQKLQSEKISAQLQTEIQLTYDRLKAAKESYNSYIELVKFNEMSLQTTAKKLEKGLVDTTEFEIAKQRLRMAKAQQLKSFLSYKIYQEILSFYQTGNWKHLKNIK